MVAAAVILFAVAAPRASAQNADAQLRAYTDVLKELGPLRLEVRGVELDLQKMRGVYPGCSDASRRTDFEQGLEAQATKLGVKAFELKGVEGSEPVPLADGRPSPMELQRWDISGRGLFVDVHRFLHRIAFVREWEPLDFDTLRVKAETGGTVSFDARINAPCFRYWGEAWADNLQASRAPLPSGHTVAAAEAEAAMYRTRLQDVRSAYATVSQLGDRLQPMRLIDALAKLDTDWGDRAVLLSELRFAAPMLTLQGVTVGESARAAIDASLRKAGFDVTGIEWSPAGDCRAFTATARLTAGQSETHGVATKEIFDERLTSMCGANLRPAAIAVTARGSGNLNLHFRDADIAEFFHVMNDLVPAEGFVVEPGVTGRVNVDIDGATFDETLAAFRSAGVAFVGPGPLHRVCNADCGEPTTPKQKSYDGEPITVTVKDAEVTDLLRTFESITELEFYLPRDFHANVSVFAHDMPWDLVFDGIFSSIRLTYVIEKTHVYLGRGSDVRKADHPGMVRFEKPAVPDRRRWLSEPDASRLGVDDIRLAALVRADGPWKAYLHVPGSPGDLVALDPGTALFDGLVLAVDPNGVTLRTTAGREVVVTLPPSVH